MGSAPPELRTGQEQLPKEKQDAIDWEGGGMRGRHTVRELALFDVQPDGHIPKESTLHSETAEAPNKAESMILFSWSHFK